MHKTGSQEVREKRVHKVKGQVKLDSTALYAREISTR